MISNKIKNKIHLIYGIFLSIVIVIAAICIMVSCIDIYQTDSYSREAVAEHFSNIAVWIYLCLATVIGGFILNLIFPFEKKKRTERQTAMLLNRLYKKIDWNQCDSHLSQAIKKEQKKRMIHFIIALMLFTLGAIIFLIYACNGANFHQSEINQSIIKAVILMGVCLFPSGAYALFASYYTKASLEREFTLVKQIKPLKEPQNADVIPAKNPYTKLIVQCVIVVIALTFLLYGLFTGGVADVITKAINICTECIGLG